MNDRSHYGAMLAAGIAALIMVVHSLVSRQGSFRLVRACLLGP